MSKKWTGDGTQLVAGGSCLKFKRAKILVVLQKLFSPNGDENLGVFFFFMPDFFTSDPSGVGPPVPLDQPPRVGPLGPPGPVPEVRTPRPPRIQLSALFKTSTTKRLMQKPGMKGCFEAE